MKTDVLIIGKGISGILLSVLLKQKGINSIILDKGHKNALPLSETIPPSTLTLLNQLGLLAIFEETSSKTYGYQSKWNSETILDQNFFNNSTYKYGLKLNKQLLLKQLETLITKNIITYDVIKDINLNQKTPLLTIKDKTKNDTIESNIIIDATGRNRILLKQIGIPSIDYDDTFAFICYVPKNEQYVKYGFFTETFDNGWGTVSNLNETTRIITLYVSKSNMHSNSFKLYKNWHQMLSNTQILKKCLPNEGFFKVMGKKANSSKPLHIAGKNWLAIGDAAIAFDPVSSHGISNAIFCCKKASEIIEKYIREESSINLKEHYEDVLSMIFKEYLFQKEKLYNKQTIMY